MVRTKPPADVLQQIGDAIAGVRFGHVQVIIHNSRIVQIEKVEKVRLDASADLASGGRQEQNDGDDRTSGSPRLDSGR